MKPSTKIAISFLLLAIIAIFYRLIPMPAGVYGFTPMFAMAIFGGAMFRNDKKYAFLLPLLTFFLSDVIFEILFSLGKWSRPGFYEGQLLNYLLFALTTCVGFFIHKIKLLKVLLAAVAAPTLFYLLSNLSVWAFSGLYPISIAGLQQCYIAGLPFYFPYSIVSTVVFSAILFGGFYAIKKASIPHTVQTA